MLAAAGAVGAQPAQPDERDALIQELRQRIEALEKKIEEKPAPPPPPPVVTPRVPKPPPKPAASEEAGRADEAARALERTLVREGGLVLPRGVTEVEPRLQYTHRGSQGFNILSTGGDPQLVQQEVRTNELEASLGLRIGLPASFQVEMRLPYIARDENRATAGVATESQSVSGWGDVELGLAKQLHAERRGGLLGSLIWKSTTGKHALGELSPGSGFPQLQAALTAVRREDPLVFFGTVTYSRIFERERSGTDVDPGDGIGFRAGALLAASPETSLRAAFELTRFARTKVAGADFPGSDATVGTLELGLATLLTGQTLLDLQLGIGVTPDAPDLRLRVALPIRFGP